MEIKYSTLSDALYSFTKSWFKSKLSSMVVRLCVRIVRLPLKQSIADRMIRVSFIEASHTIVKREVNNNFAQITLHITTGIYMDFVMFVLICKN